MKPWKRYQAPHSQSVSNDQQAAQRGPWDRYQQPKQEATSWPEGQSVQDMAGLPGFEDMPPVMAPAQIRGRMANAADTIRNVGRDAARGAGLAARNVIEGAGAPLIAATDLAGSAIYGNDYRPVRQTLTDLGLPEPATRAERVVSAAGEGAAAANTGIGLGRILMDAAGPGTRAVGGLLSEAPAAQLAGGAGAGSSGQVAAEHTDNPLIRLAASVGGGFVSGAPFTSRGSAAPHLADRNADAALAAPVPRGAATTADQLSTMRRQLEQFEPAAREAAGEIGVDWNALDEGLRARITHAVAQATQTKDLQPEAAARAAFYESLDLTPTRGMATRRLADTQAEGVAKRTGTTESEPLRQIDAQNNAAIRNRLLELVPAGAEPTDAPTFGQQFRAPLVEGERRAQQVTNRAYQRAMEVEGGREAPIDQLNQFLTDNAGVLNNRPASAGLVDDLRKIGLLRDDWHAPGSKPFALGNLADKPSRFTLRDLASARAAVNEAWDTAKRTGDTRAANRLSEMRRLMDGVEGEAGGELFKAYRQLRVKKGDRYEDNPLIDKLISDQKGYYGTDLIEDSKVFDKAVLSSTTEQFGKVWPRLTPKAKDLTRAQVAKYIEERAFSNLGRNELADPVASAAKLNQALSSLNPQKLELIFGKGKAQQLASLNKALIEIANPPAGSIPTGSAPALMQLAGGVFRILGRGLGGGSSVVNDYAAGVVGNIKSGAQSRRNAATTRRALDFMPQPQPSASDAISNRLLQLALPAGYGAAAVQD